MAPGSILNPQSSNPILKPKPKPKPKLKLKLKPNMVNKIRTIKQIITTEDVMMGDVKVGQPLPTQQVRQISPFLLLHHLGPIQITPGVNPMDIGAHPHRGLLQLLLCTQAG